MVQRANIAIDSEKNRKHINAVWQNVKLFIAGRVGALHNK
jgi:hypothetical protein